VTALVARRGQDERVRVYLDGRSAFDVSAVIAERAGLRAGDLLSADEQQRLYEQDAPFRARERALRLLGVRDRSRREVEMRLRRAGFEPQVVADTVAWLQDLNYLDDRRFAFAYAEEKQRSGWAPRRIRAELAGKGLERGVVEEVLAPLEEAEAARAGDDAGEGVYAIEEAARRRFAAQFATDPAAAERRLVGYLARRGYDWDTIGRVARTLRAEASSEG
jgi:regulatory protein